MRLITRADLDGLTCALLLSEVEPIEQVTFAHPKDVQDGKVDVGPNDILANLPYDARAAKWFDHHVSEKPHAQEASAGKFEVSPSAARVVVDAYPAFDFSKYKSLMVDTDRLDSAQLDPKDVTAPGGWILLGYTLDPRTGGGRFQDYFKHVMELVKANPGNPDAVLADEQVAARVKALHEAEAAFATHLKADSKVDGNVIVTDVRGKKDLPQGNRFTIYTLFPSGNVSVRIASGHDGTYCSIQVGHSIFNRTCKTNVGELMNTYGGGGHHGAGTCQPKAEDADRVLAEIISTLKANG